MVAQYHKEYEEVLDTVFNAIVDSHTSEDVDIDYAPSHSIMETFYNFLKDSSYEFGFDGKITLDDDYKYVQPSWSGYLGFILLDQSCSFYALEFYTKIYVLLFMIQLLEPEHRKIIADNIIKTGIPKEDDQRILNLKKVIEKINKYDYKSKNLI